MIFWKSLEKRRDWEVLGFPVEWGLNWRLLTYNMQMTLLSSVMLNKTNSRFKGNLRSFWSYLWASHQLEQEFLVSSKWSPWFTPFLARILGGRTGDLPTTYLGMPLGAKSKSIGIWNGVIEKCEKRLVNWKSQYLSLGGRLTPINSVLDSMPAYMMSLFPIPDGVMDRLDALRRNFLWEGNSETKKFHLVKWDTLIKSKQAGGWGYGI